jgi:hypothetical protein
MNFPACQEKWVEFWGFSLFVPSAARQWQMNGIQMFPTFQYNDGKNKKAIDNRTKHTNTESLPPRYTPPPPAPALFFFVFPSFYSGASGPTIGANPQIKQFFAYHAANPIAQNKIQNCYRSYTLGNNKIIIIITVYYLLFIIYFSSSENFIYLFIYLNKKALTQSPPLKFFFFFFISNK